MGNRRITASLLVAGSLFLSIALPAPAATPDHHGMQVRLAACAACHGKHGEGKPKSEAGVYPRLAGQPAGYLYQQMVRFRSGGRSGIPAAAIMEEQLDQLSDSYLHLIARYYSRSDPPFPPREKVAPAVLAQGRELAQNGIPRLGVKTCTRCHGAHLEGNAPADVPALAGQYARYLKLQFKHWIQGDRKDAYHENTARNLSPAQINTLVTYLAWLRPAALAPENQSEPAETPAPAGTAP